MDLKDGAVTDLDFLPGRQPDVDSGPEVGAAVAGQLALRLKDLGFFDLDMAARDVGIGVHWVGRLPSGVTLLREGDRPAEVDRGVPGPASRGRGGRVGARLEAGRRRWRCRLVAVRCPEAVRQKRLRKARRNRAARKGRQVSAPTAGAVRLDGAEPPTCRPRRLTFDEAWVLYRARWQIELLFKLWKGRGGLARSRGAAAATGCCAGAGQTVGDAGAALVAPDGGPVAGRQGGDAQVQRLRPAAHGVGRGPWATARPWRPCCGGFGRNCIAFVPATGARRSREPSSYLTNRGERG